MAMPKVRLGEPELEDDFNLYEIDGIKVYISKVLIPKKDIHIKLNSFVGLFKSLEVYGFELF